MDKIKIGVMGAGRGTSMINYCKMADDIELVAICDHFEEALSQHRKSAEELGIALYEKFDDFIEHDMDAIVLANYANEHAPFAIRAMKKGLHVYSEVLPCQNLKEAVELIETVEETGMTYVYGENYGYMLHLQKMRRKYQAGEIGEFEYGECEYIHNCAPEWYGLTYGQSDHWRNNLFSTFYCTHSIGPLIQMTGLRPVSVIGIEGTRCARNEAVGSKAGLFGMELVTLENGAIIKSIHGGLYKNSVWYSVYGTKGVMETQRGIPATINKTSNILFSAIDEYEGGHETEKLSAVEAKPQSEDAEKFGHGGSDFFTMNNFVKAIRGDKTADIIDVYQAMDMFLPGLFAYFSILDGSVPKEIPDLRNKEERDKWRNNTACTDPKAAGDMLLPTRLGGTPNIESAVYEHQKMLWDKLVEDRKKEQEEA